MTNEASRSFVDPDLSGRVVLITGGSRGIGRRVAERMADCGADVAVVARSTESRKLLPGTIHETVASIEERGRRGLAVRCDVRKEEAVAAAVEQTVAELGRLDAVIHNAGALWWETVEGTPMRRFDLVMDVNVRGAFALAQAALPHLESAGGGHVIVYSPPIDIRFLPGKVAYGISKLGMTMLALGLAPEVEHLGISANALWPATAIESQATINHAIGTRDMWRSADIVADATLAILARPASELTGRALLDEEILAEAGVTEFEEYSCVPGGTPLRIVGDAAANTIWKHQFDRPAPPRDAS